MEKARRDLLKSALAGMTALALPRSTLADAAGDAAILTTLTAFVDVLLPADDLSPAASALAVPADILALAAEVAGFRKLIDYGCSWLDKTGGPPFHLLASDKQHRIVAFMAASDMAQAPRRFYHLVRLSAIEHYYSHPEARAGLHLNTAPQPEGYPPPWT
jgi:hypothetical protein